MYNDKKVVVVMPAYNAEQTIQKTHDEVLVQGFVDLVIVVDDASSDNTTAVAQDLPNTIVHTHIQNRGYGGNQKSCYTLALEQGADIVIMVHPDYQYTPLLIPAMASMIGNGLYHCVLGSRILGGHALKGGMPIWKYIANRFLTFSENLLTGAKLSEYHTGYRAFSRELLEKLPLEQMTTKCWGRFSGMVIKSPRSVVRQNTSPKRPRLISGAAANMVSDVSGSACNTA
jgi:glycosyltransferase involved in cell wall biosynthesis